MKTISQSLFILTLLACAILVAMEMLPNVTNQSNAFDSPLPTPVIPDPTPDLPKETQQALEYIVC